MKSNNKIPLVNNNLFIEKPNLLNKSVNIGKNSFGINPIIILKSHLDSVRCLHLINDSKMLITAGDDMLINFWDLKKILCSQKESHEPFLSIRGHNNPIFTLTGNEQFVFSSGMDGIIRNWKIPKSPISKYTSYEETFNDMSHNSWRAHQDMIWGLSAGGDKSLGSLSADGSVKLWKFPDDTNSDKISILCNNNSV